MTLSHNYSGEQLLRKHVWLDLGQTYILYQVLGCVMDSVNDNHSHILLTLTDVHVDQLWTFYAVTY